MSTAFHDEIPLKQWHAGFSSTNTGNIFLLCTLITSVFLQTIKLLCLEAIEHPKENKSIQYKWRLSEKEKFSCQFTAMVFVLWTPHQSVKIYDCLECRQLAVQSLKGLRGLAGIVGDTVFFFKCKVFLEHELLYSIWNYFQFSIQVLSVVKRLWKN